MSITETKPLVFILFLIITWMLDNWQPHWLELVKHTDLLVSSPTFKYFTSGYSDTQFSKLAIAVDCSKTEFKIRYVSQKLRSIMSNISRSRTFARGKNSIKIETSSTKKCWLLQICKHLWITVWFCNKSHWFNFYVEKYFFSDHRA